MALLQQLAGGDEFPPVQVKIEERNIIIIAAAVVLTFALVLLIKKAVK